MRRWLLFLLLCMGAKAATAQERRATVELEDGRVFAGLVVHMDRNSITVEVDGKRHSFATQQIASCQFDLLDPAAAVPAAAPPAVGSTSPAEMPLRVGLRSSRGLWRARVEALDDALPWLSPADPAQWISLGIMLFALLSLAVHLAVRLSASEHLGFGRAAVLAAWFLVIWLLQVATVPGSPVALAIVGTINVAFAALCLRVAYDLATASAGLAVFLIVVQGGIAYSLLMLVDATLRSIGQTTF